MLQERNGGGVCVGVLVLVPSVLWTCASAFCASWKAQHYYESSYLSILGKNAGQSISKNLESRY